LKKKKSSGGGANWMDTYGDMVTLLLCFFVLLYSMSTISEEAWKNLVMSFNPYAVAEGEVPDNESAGPSSEGEDAGIMPEPDEMDQEQIDADIEQLYMSLQAMAVSQGVTESVSVSKDGGKIYVTFDGTAFFKGNSYALTAEALPVLDSMSEMLSSVAYSIDEVRVIGHTAQYSADKPNNPETDYILSSQRASKVVAYIVDRTRNEVLDPAKFSVEGKGQWQPVASNETEEGKAKNRRVEMIISGRNLEEELESGDGVQSYYTEGQAPSASPGSPAESSVSPESSASPEASASQAADEP